MTTANGYQASIPARHPHTTMVSSLCPCACLFTWIHKCGARPVFFTGCSTHNVLSRFPKSLVWLQHRNRQHSKALYLPGNLSWCSYKEGTICSPFYRGLQASKRQFPLSIFLTGTRLNGVCTMCECVRVCVCVCRLEGGKNLMVRFSIKYKINNSSKKMFFAIINS